MSLYLSMLSLVLSACALLIALDRGGGIGHGEQLVAPASAPKANRVTIEGLTIAPGQILPSACLAQGGGGAYLWYVLRIQPGFRLSMSSLGCFKFPGDS